MSQSDVHLDDLVTNVYLDDLVTNVHADDLVSITSCHSAEISHPVIKKYGDKNPSVIH